MRVPASVLTLLPPLFVSLALAACGEPREEPAAPAPDAVVAVDSEGRVAEEPVWIDTRGTSVLGFGILRLVPPEGAAGRYRLHYADRPDGYTITDNAQFFVLPGNAFAEREMAYADEFMAFARTVPAKRDPSYDTSAAKLELDVEIEVSDETTVLVAYGPWEGPDVGRPAGDEHTFTLRVEPLGPGAAYEWVESEAGELITTNWTLRPGLARGEPTTDPVTGDDVWVEVRPLIMYDSRLVRAADEPAVADLGAAPDPAEMLAEAERLEREGKSALADDARERAEDLLAVAARDDRRIVLTPELARRFRRVPIRWR